jgi:hypothetical protein
VYDITSSESFTRAKAWVRELQRQGSPNMIMALAGEEGRRGQRHGRHCRHSRRGGGAGGCTTKGVHRVCSRQGVIRTGSACTCRHLPTAAAAAAAAEGG